MVETFLKQTESRGVVGGLNSSLFRTRRVSYWLLAGCLGWMSVGELPAAVREVPAPLFGQKKRVSTPKPKPLTSDELRFNDGDLVRGKFVGREGEILVFKSERFGLLRVPAATVKLTLADPPPAVAADAVSSDNKGDVEVERASFSVLALTSGLKEFFGSWHGRFTMSAEMMRDGVERNSGSVDGRLTRLWTNDEVQLSGRYDYATLDQTTSSIDMIKGAGVWRHDFPSRLFAVYRPTLEWNRAYFRSGVPADYVLLQQEWGVGVNLLDTEPRKLRVGVAENLFDTWITPTQTHLSQTVESVFVEIEAKLPWRIILTDRGVWYYSFANQTQGWENRFEISKKLTDTLTMGVRHEVRYNNPDVRSADYRRLRLLFGFDF